MSSETTNTKDEKDLSPSNPETGGAEAQEAGAGEQEKAITYINSYQRGLVNGALEVPAEPYNSFLDSYYSADTVLYELTKLDKEVQEERSLVINARAKSGEIAGELVRVNKDLAKYSVKKNYFLQVLDRLKERLALAKAKLEWIKKEYQSDYTLFAGVVFFAAALVFMIADYGIALTVVADGMKIGIKTNTESPELGNDYTYIAHTLAIGMSLLAVLLKPAYDRLVEKNFLKGQYIKRFNWTILVSAALVLALLLMLGIFREGEFEKGQKVMEQMNASSQQAVADDSFIDSPGQDEGFNHSMPPTNLPDIAGSVSANQLSEGPEEKTFHEKVGGWGIVLSTMLFAIAGAICLGISLPVLHRNYRIFYNYLTQSIFRRRIFTLERQIRENEVQLNRLHCDQQHLEKQITELGETLAMEPALREKNQRLIALYEAFNKLRAQKESAVYQDAYNRGVRLKDNIPEEWISQRVIFNTSLDNPENEYGDVNGTAEGRSRKPRPFVAIRKMISQRFRKNYFNYPESDVELYNNEN